MAKIFERWFFTTLRLKSWFSREDRRSVSVVQVTLVTSELFARNKVGLSLSCGSFLDEHGSQTFRQPSSRIINKTLPKALSCYTIYKYRNFQKTDFSSKTVMLIQRLAINLRLLIMNLNLDVFDSLMYLKKMLQKTSIWYRNITPKLSSPGQ